MILSENKSKLLCTHSWLGEAMQWQPISEGARRQISADDIQTV